jgi:hypothetical protein
MRRRPLTTLSGSCYADFGLSPLEIFKCTFCGITQRAAMADTHFSLIGYVVPPGPLCPVTGMVGICVHCLPKVWSHFAGEVKCWGPFQRTDRSWSPPATVQPIPREPIYILIRKFCDEERLAELVRSSWTRIPARARRRLRAHWKTQEGSHSLSSGPLRIEALPSWPEFRQCLGMCMTAGHAIRLHSLTVQAAPDEVVSTLIAHEIAHVYQFATGANWNRPNRVIKEEVSRLLDGWGFRESAISKWCQKQSDERFYAMLRRKEEKWNRQRKVIAAR